MAEQVAVTIESLLKKQSLWPEVMRWAAIEVWDKAVGEKVATRARPFAVSAGCLMVAVESSAWRQELHLMKPAILRRLNSMLGGEYLKDIRFAARRPRQLIEPGAAGDGTSTGSAGGGDISDLPWPGPGSLEITPLEDGDWDRIQALLTRAQDESAARALQRLLVTATRRRNLLKRAGMKPCPACGALTRGGLCPVCRTQEKAKNQARALALLSEVPWLDVVGLKEMDAHLGEKEYLTARDTLLSLWSKEVKDLRGKRSKASQQSLRLARANLAMLLTNTAPEDLTDEIVDQAVPEKRSPGTQKP